MCEYIYIFVHCSIYMYTPEYVYKLHFDFYTLANFPPAIDLFKLCTVNEGEASSRYTPATLKLTCGGAGGAGGAGGVGGGGEGEGLFLHLPCFHTQGTVPGAAVPFEMNKSMLTPNATCTAARQHF